MRLTFFVILLLVFTSCANSRLNRTTSNSNDNLQYKIEYDPKFDPNVIGFYKEILNLPSTYIHDEKTGDTAFVKAFGAPSFKSVEYYLTKRIHYLVELDPDWAKKNGLPESSVQISPAQNITSSLWGLYVAHFFETGQKLDLFKLDNVEVPYSEDRLGVIQLNTAIFQKQAPITALRILIHEARHSDCSDGLLKSNSRDTNKLDLVSEPHKITCFYQHSMCPDGDLKGQEVCDEKIWGAYTMEYLFIREIALHCTNCDVSSKLNANIAALTRAARLLYLPKKLHKKILAFFHPKYNVYYDRILLPKYQRLSNTKTKATEDNLFYKGIDRLLTEVDQYLLNLPPPNMETNPIIRWTNSN